MGAPASRYNGHTALRLAVLAAAAVAIAAVAVVVVMVVVVVVAVTVVMLDAIRERILQCTLCTR